MDRDGYWKIRDALGSGVKVEPMPEHDEDLQFVMVSFEGFSRIPEVMNQLGKASLTGVAAENNDGPNLELAGQLYSGGPQRPTVYLTFEDVNHSNSNWLGPNQE